jgi:hypothetical protein
MGQPAYRFGNLHPRAAGSVNNLSHFDLGGRRPALAYAVMPSLISQSFSSSMFEYPLVDRAVPAMCRERAMARLRADWPSGKAPNHPGALPDLTQDAFKGIIGPDAPAMFLEPAVVPERAASKRSTPSSTLTRTTRLGRLLIRSSSIVMTLPSGLASLSDMPAPVCAVLLGLATSSSARFGAASPGMPIRFRRDA